MNTNTFNRSNIQKAFNIQFFKFVDNVEALFPLNNDIKKASTALYSIKKMNPKLIISIWKLYVVDKYAEKLYNDDIEYFLNKDYSDDIQLHSKNEEIMTAIDNIRLPLRNLDDTNKSETLEYLKQLCKLCTLYFLTK